METNHSAVLIRFSSVLIISFILVCNLYGENEILYGISEESELTQTAVLSSPRHIYPTQVSGTFSDIKHESIDYWISYYTSETNRGWIQNLILKSGIYRGFIREEVLRRLLPPELTFLPALESGYNPLAISKSGASGLWQFMTNSISPYNMTVTEWIDERRDLYKSTTGALDKLQYNYTVLGDWVLAIAAYNCGLGCVQRAVKKEGTSDYWQLRDSLPGETQDYIPKFIALSKIFLSPERFGYLSLDTPPQVWSFIPYQGNINFTLVSKESGIPLDKLLQWHPELNTAVSPPDLPSFTLKVPKEYSDIINSILYKDRFDDTEYYYRKIRHGDTLYSISKSYNIPVDIVMLHNPGLIPRSMLVGDIILIPKKMSTPPEERAVLYEVLEKYTTYTVQKGDTLWSIAREYNTRPDELAHWNSLSATAIIQPGQQLKVPIIVEEQE